MARDELFLFGVFVVQSVVFIGLGIPLAAGRVVPNSLYGYRTRRTLSDAGAWYAANRVCGWWCIATGFATLLVTAIAANSGTKPPSSVYLTIATLLVGVIAMVVHGAIAARRTGLRV
jgi:uncharacterized membrane protein